MPAMDISGTTFGRLTAMRLVPGTGTTRWLCQCECGNQPTVGIRNLRGGTTRSCGCLRRDTTRQRMTRHGSAGRGKKTPEYVAWRSMIDRCELESNSHFHGYGGRGIKVCDKWRGNFEAFLADMGARPSSVHSIDRVDVNGNYEPDNCRWTTDDVQARNTRRNRFFTHAGETMCLADWCKRFGQTQPNAHWRLASGWTFEEAMKLTMRGHGSPKPALPR